MIIIRYAKMGYGMGVVEYGNLRSYGCDAVLLVGFNPRIKLIRTQTDRGGVPYCDSPYELES